MQSWLRGREDEHLEFKRAERGYDFDELARYCVALANEGGGALILGVTNTEPRQIVGSQASADLDGVKVRLIDALRLRIDVQELQHPAGRVLVFRVPPRPLGVPLHYRGAYYMRVGESLVGMTPDQLRRIVSETEPDFSAQACTRATLEDLDRVAIARFRDLWARRSDNPALAALSDEQLLRDADLLAPKGLTYAALVLFGTRQALVRHLAQAEVVFEYRSDEIPGPAQQREEYRQGFFLFRDELWDKINLRNDLQHLQHGFVMLPVPTLNEGVVREAILNAVSHRDYRLPGSVFVRQYPRRLEITSPGGFTPGIDETNILNRQAPRNRLIAEALARCGLVERAGQGMDRMFRECIREGKLRPDFRGTGPYQVSVTLWGEIQDARFLRFLERIGQERLAAFTTQDFVLLDLIHREQALPVDLRPRLPVLVGQGVVERVGRGRGVRYILSRRFYEFLGQAGVYTRQRGLDREQNKALLLQHIRGQGDKGSPLAEIEQVLPALSRQPLQGLLRKLRAEGHIHMAGRTRGARWYPGRG